MRWIWASEIGDDRRLRIYDDETTEKTFLQLAMCIVLDMVE